MRYARLSRIRHSPLVIVLLLHLWDEADKIALDSNYMAHRRIVINWAADGLVLCFMHAVTDLNPKDNDNTKHPGRTGVGRRTWPCSK